MSTDIELNTGNEPPEKRNIISTIFAGIWRLVLKLPRKLRIVLSIVGCTVLVIALLVMLQPEAQKRAIPETIVKVDVVEVSESNYPILVTTSGTIQADTRGNLVSQIRGEIVSVSDQFKTGGAFAKGDVLIEIDQRDYLADLSQALAAVSQAKAAFRQEQANAKQAANDWARLGNSGSPPDLVARKPQLAAARAQLESANAAHETAKLNLERTKIKAPYKGRVISRQAALGQYVSVGTVLAEIFATDGVEARLPLSQAEYVQLGLDNLNSDLAAPQYRVILDSEVGTRRYTWDAVITRADSTFDLNTRQIDVIATVIDPFGIKDNSKPPLKIGQFVNATIEGRTIENAIVVPNKAIREGSYVFVSENERLVRTPVQIAWQDDQNTLIELGLSVGDLVVTTSLNSTLAGAKVKLGDDREARTAERANRLQPKAPPSEQPQDSPAGGRQNNAESTESDNAKVNDKANSQQSGDSLESAKGSNAAAKL